MGSRASEDGASIERSIYRLINIAEYVTDHHFAALTAPMLFL
jgi:hypothetical protein